jgi:hypothetical protein
MAHYLDGTPWWDELTDEQKWAIDMRINRRPLNEIPPMTDAIFQHVGDFKEKPFHQRLNSRAHRRNQKRKKD